MPVRTRIAVEEKETIVEECLPGGLSPSHSDPKKTTDEKSVLESMKSPCF